MIGIFFKGSHMWGVLFLRFLEECGIPFEILSPNSLEHIAHLSLLIMPGGWASRRARLLKKRGREQIREYVARGGIYLGVCGGAGLALSPRAGGMGLCEAVRKPMYQRCPNFSGHILSTICSSTLSPFEKGELVSLPMWWPSQFDISPCGQEVEVLATYSRPGDDLWMADLPWWVLEGEKELSGWEKMYGINLSFHILKNEPAILYGRYHRGKYILSYSHLETPASPQANSWLAYLLKDMVKDSPVSHPSPSLNLTSPHIAWEDECLLESWKKLLELINLAQENLLMCWRNSWLLGWKRGVPGLCLNALLILVVHLLEKIPSPEVMELWKREKGGFKATFHKFYREVITYMRMYRLYTIKNPPRSPDREEKWALDQHLKTLTGGFPGDGGLFKALSDLLERLIALNYLNLSRVL